MGVLMRLDNLEWERNHRIFTSSLAQSNSPSMVLYDWWKMTLSLHSLHPRVMDQVCLRTVDASLAEERDFMRARAKRMLALFLRAVFAQHRGARAGGQRQFGSGGELPRFHQGCGPVGGDDAQAEERVIGFCIRTIQR